MPLETPSVAPIGVGDAAPVNVTVTTGFVVDDPANKIMNNGDNWPAVNAEAMALHEMANPSPVFKLSDVLDVTAVPLKYQEAVPLALAV